METEIVVDDVTYEPILENEFERAVEVLRSVLALVEDIRRGPAIVSIE